MGFIFIQNAVVCVPKSMRISSSFLSVL